MSSYNTALRELECPVIPITSLDLNNIRDFRSYQLTSLVQNNIALTLYPNSIVTNNTGLIF